MEAAAPVPQSLLKWVTPEETAAEFFRRQGREALATGLPFVDTHVKLRPGHILELAGPAGSAKTELLLQARLTVQALDSCAGSPSSQLSCWYCHCYVPTQMVANMLFSTRSIQDEQEQGKQQCAVCPWSLPRAASKPARSAATKHGATSRASVVLALCSDHACAATVCGTAEHAVLVDSDGKFDTLRLLQVGGAGWQHVTQQVPLCHPACSDCLTLKCLGCTAQRHKQPGVCCVVTPADAGAGGQGAWLSSSTAAQVSLGECDPRCQPKRLTDSHNNPECAVWCPRRPKGCPQTATKALAMCQFFELWLEDFETP